MADSIVTLDPKAVEERFAAIEEQLAGASTLRVEHYRALKDRVGQQDKIIEQLRDRVAVDRDARTKLDREVVAQAKRIEELEVRLEQGVSRRVELAQTVARQGATIEEQAKKIEVLHERADIARRHRSKISRTVKVRTEEIEAQKSTIEALSQRANIARGAVITLETRADGLSQSIKALEKAAEELKGHTTEIDETVAEMKRQSREGPTDGLQRMCRAYTRLDLVEKAVEGLEGHIAEIDESIAVTQRQAEVEPTPHPDKMIRVFLRLENVEEAVHDLKGRMATREAVGRRTFAMLEKHTKDHEELKGRMVHRETVGQLVAEGLARRGEAHEELSKRVEVLEGAGGPKGAERPDGRMRVWFGDKYDELVGEAANAVLLDSTYGELGPKDTLAAIGWLRRQRGWGRKGP